MVEEFVRPTGHEDIGIRNQIVLPDRQPKVVIRRLAIVAWQLSV
jgi:hypothetical protein